MYGSSLSWVQAVACCFFPLGFYIHLHCFIGPWTREALPVLVIGGFSYRAVMASTKVVVPFLAVYP